MSRYQIAPQAKKDLDAIWDRIARNTSADTATNFLWKFYETFRSIASSPAAGIAAPDFEPEGIRKFPMGNYIIYYRLVRRGQSNVVISRVLHGKRQQKQSYYKAEPPF